MKVLSPDIEHVVTPEGVLLYRTTDDAWFIAEGEAAAAATGPAEDSAGLDTLRAAGLAAGTPRTNGRGRVRQVDAGVALALLDSLVALAPGAAFAMSESSSYSSPTPM